MKTEKYEHHGVEVSVVAAVKGQHRQHCLCYTCGRFNPESVEDKCPIAAAIYANCVEFNVVTPVYECPKYAEKLG